LAVSVCERVTQLLVLNEYWAVAAPSDPVEAAPQLPRDPRTFLFRHAP
jgi:hypothetical protein